MTIRHLTPADYLTTKWSGGLTTQLAIAPAGAVYAERDFLWRLSSATVEDAESTFTALPDYERLISTLAGEIELSHNGGERFALRPYEVHRFDGADDTRSWGRCRDFNLMLRKGACEGTLHGIDLPAAARKTVSAAGTLVVYCGEGTVNVCVGEECVTLSADEAARIDDYCADVVLCTPSGAQLLTASIKAVN